MALSTKAIFASCHSPVGPSRIPPIGKLNPFTLSCLPAAHKWSIAQDQTLVSSPLEHSNGGSRFHYQESFSVEHAEKLEAFKHVLRSVGKDPFEGLNMIDAIQRLSIDYHFQEEIEAILQSQYAKSSTHGDFINLDLHGVSLSFRLLRQQGYNIPTDVFNNFKDKEGNFNKELSEDINGLMGLYEASQLSVKGEEILDEAGNFSGQLLNALVTNLDHYQGRVVGNTLEHPFHKTLPRFMARNYFGNLQATNGWIDDLQDLARMDFHLVQSIYQKEVVQITKWCGDLGLSKELSLARDQPLKWYIWSMACLTDPDLSEQRVDLTKSISLIYIIDDIFDVYGTLDELTLFTEAVNKWDFAALDHLPEYMKICFKALYDNINEISYKIYQKHGWNPVDSLRKSWASLCNAFLVEAEWFASGHSPKAEEYLKNGVISSGVPVVLVQIFFLLGQGFTKESADLVNGVPDIISSTATILRLWDDLGSAKDENQDGHDGSYIDYYMKEHEGSSIKEAREHVINMISDAWKRLNKECFFPNSLFPAKFTNASLNFARMVPLMYNYDHNQRLPTLEEHMKSVLYEIVSM